MRLSKEYVDIFIQSISGFLTNNEKVELRLYGSRVSDQLKGGDIDLLLITDSSTLANHLRQNKVHILSKVFMKIEEQKIDLTITDKSNLQDPFIKKAYSSSILLYQWN